MSDYLIVAGILSIVTVSEFVLWKIYEFFGDGDEIPFLLGTNIVVITILIALRFFGK